MTAQLAYDEIATLLADMDPAKLVGLKASAAFQKRMEYLLEKNREANLTPDEKVEIEHYLIINRLFSMAKLKARRKLSALLADDKENFQ